MGQKQSARQKSNWYISLCAFAMFLWCEWNERLVKRITDFSLVQCVYLSRYQSSLENEDKIVWIRMHSQIDILSFIFSFFLLLLLSFFLLKFFLSFSFFEVLNPMWHRKLTQILLPYSHMQNSENTIFIKYIWYFLCIQCEVIKVVLAGKLYIQYSG